MHKSSMSMSRSRCISTAIIKGYNKNKTNKHKYKQKKEILSVKNHNLFWISVCISVMRSRIVACCCYYANDNVFFGGSSFTESSNNYFIRVIIFTFCFSIAYDRYWSTFDISFLKGYYRSNNDRILIDKFELHQLMKINFC